MTAHLGSDGKGIKHTSMFILGHKEKYWHDIGMITVEKIERFAVEIDFLLLTILLETHCS